MTIYSDNFKLISAQKLHKAVKTEDADEVRKFLDSLTKTERIAAVLSQDADCRSPFHYANGVMAAHLITALPTEQRIEAIMIQDGVGANSLHAAAQQGLKAYIETILNALPESDRFKAIMQRTREDNTCLDVAVRYGQFDVVKLFIDILKTKKIFQEIALENPWLVMEANRSPEKFKNHLSEFYAWMEEPLTQHILLMVNSFDPPDIVGSNYVSLISDENHCPKSTGSYTILMQDLMQKHVLEASDDELPKAMQHALFKHCDLGMVEDISAKQLVLYPTLWKDHATCLVFYGGYMARCDGLHRFILMGDGSVSLAPSITTYKIRAELFTQELLKEIFAQTDKSFDEALPFFRDILPKRLGVVLPTSIEQGIEEVKNDPCLMQMILSTPKRQKSGNCPWASLKIAIRATAVFLTVLADAGSPLKGLNAKKITKIFFTSVRKKLLDGYKTLPTAHPEVIRRCQEKLEKHRMGLHDISESVKAILD